MNMFGNPFGGGGGGGGQDQLAQTLMQNPAIQNYVRQVMSDPQMMQQVSCCHFSPCAPVQD